MRTTVISWTRAVCYLHLPMKIRTTLPWYPRQPDKVGGGSEGGITNRVIELDGKVALKPELPTGWSGARWIAVRFAALNQ